MTPITERTNHLYPSSDGKPMAETNRHRVVTNDLIETIGAHFENDPLIYCAGNMLIYPDRDDRHKHYSPDVFVVRGVEKSERDNYLIFEEGKAPDLIIEVTSKTTWQDDSETKFDVYRDKWKVSEYFLFDPNDQYLIPRLQGYRLIDGEYVRIEAVDGRLPSEVLGLHLEPVGNELRLYNPATGELLLVPREWRDKLAEEKQRADELRAIAEQEARDRENAERRARLEVAARQQVEREAEDARAAEVKERQAREQAEAQSARERAAREAAEKAREAAEKARLRAEAEAAREQQAREQAETEKVRERAAREQAEADRAATLTELNRLRQQLELVRQTSPTHDTP